MQKNVVSQFQPENIHFFIITKHCPAPSTTYLLSHFPLQALRRLLHRPPISIKKNPPNLLFLCKKYSIKSRYFVFLIFSSTGCFNAKPDVLNCSCDLDFEFLVFWLSLVWSWVVEIYAWNFFDLRQPQQPQIKSVQIQSWFCSFFVQILINFLLVLSLYDSIFSENNSLPDEFNNMFGFSSLFTSFCYTYENN